MVGGTVRHWVQAKHVESYQSLCDCSGSTQPDNNPKKSRLLQAPVKSSCCKYCQASIDIQCAYALRQHTVSPMTMEALRGPHPGPCIVKDRFSSCTQPH